LILNNLQSVNMFSANTSFATLCGVVLLALMGPVGHARGETPPAIPGVQTALPDAPAVTTIAEVESKVTASGREAVKLVPADRVVPGDRVLYTLEVRNVGATAMLAPAVTNPIPDHMRYVADSAVGPGAEVTYSADGGHSFGQAENLKVQAPDGQMRPAVAADYTHIRWQLKHNLKPNSVAFIRFRAVVK
jgi:uncharacterized repeat protein (TIGR01451 family)